VSNPPNLEAGSAVSIPYDAYKWYLAGYKAAYTGFDPRSFIVKYIVDKVRLVFL
jgi:hypothetical protein